MISPQYRIFASEPSNLQIFTSLMMFVIKFTRTTNKQGGRGSYFMSLVTETILRHIQLCLSKVLLKYLEMATNKQIDPQDKVIENILNENRFFSMQAFYKYVATYSERTRLVSVNTIPQISKEDVPWDWFMQHIPGEKKYNDQNLFTFNWFRDVYQHYQETASDPTIPSAWNGEKLAKHAPYKLAKFIREGIQPHNRTCYLLLAVYREVGFEIPLFDSTEFVHDIVGARLEAFCRLFIGTVMIKYHVYDDILQQYKFREQIIRELSNPKGNVKTL